MVRFLLGNLLVLTLTHERATDCGSVRGAIRGLARFEAKEKLAIGDIAAFELDVAPE